MPDKPPTMRVQYKKVEKQERSRLEAILMDPAKTEADREFARERLQAIREAAVTRAKVRAARRADYVEPKPAEENAKEDVVVEDDYPPTKPTLEECVGDEDILRDETELWQIELNDPRGPQSSGFSEEFSDSPPERGTHATKGCAAPSRNLSHDLRFRWRACLCFHTRSHGAGACGFVAMWTYSNRVTLKARQHTRKNTSNGAKTSAERTRKNGPNSDGKIPRSMPVNCKPTTRQKENVSKVWLALTTAGRRLTATDK